MNTLTQYTDSKIQDVQFNDLLVTNTTPQAARSFFQEYHYSGGMGNAAIPVGVYHQPSSELLGAIAFHAPISENVRRSVFGDGREDEVIALQRLALHPKAPANTGSWFISRALDWLKGYKPNYKAVITFADTTEGHDGTVYQACSADYYGMSPPKTYYKDQEGVLRAPRQNGKNISKQDAKKRGWTPVERQAKHRYVFWLPDEYESKDKLRNECNLTIQNYPE
jgi:hypothetical protein